ncbi:hypothetical protein M404DRAFT_994929, partial [Pisolithus tinctorius Marx 270]
PEDMWVSTRYGGPSCGTGMRPDGRGLDNTKCRGTCQEPERARQMAHVTTTEYVAPRKVKGDATSATISTAKYVKLGGLYQYYRRNQRQAAV